MFRSFCALDAACRQSQVVGGRRGLHTIYRRCC